MTCRSSPVDCQRHSRFVVRKEPEFYNQAVIRWFGEIRIIPDFIIILFGVIPLLLFILRTVGRLKPVQVRDNAVITMIMDKKSQAF